jgi:molybdenum cofactor cytidylyltransferase
MFAALFAMSASDSTKPRLCGLVLAAGRSRRMGTLKQTLPWPAWPSTVISSSFDAIQPWCQKMVLVVGADAQSVTAALGTREFIRVDADSDAPMFDSIRAGLRAIIDQTRTPIPGDAVLLQPGDHPGVARATIDGMLMAFAAAPSRAVMPQYRGSGGHPVLVPRSLIAPILAFDGDGGLRQFWLDHPGLCIRMAVDDRLCVHDVDTPGDYYGRARP